MWCRCFGAPIWTSAVAEAEVTGDEAGEVAWGSERPPDLPVAVVDLGGHPVGITGRHQAGHAAVTCVGLGLPFDVEAERGEPGRDRLERLRVSDLPRDAGPVVAQTLPKGEAMVVLVPAQQQCVGAVGPLRQDARTCDRCITPHRISTGWPSR